jgi:hypothetical protein
MTDDELQAIHDRVVKATRGPWLSDNRVEDWIAQTRRHVGVYVRFYQRNGRLNHVSFVDARRVGFPNGSLRPLHDATFIAHARADVPALLAEVKRLQATVRAWEAWHDRIEGRP